MDDLEPKKCIVTAAAQGIGREAALAMAEAGFDVLATDINAEAIERLSAEQGVRSAVLDVCDAEAVRSLVQREGAVGALVYCAGTVHDGTILDANDADIAATMDINLVSAIRISQLVLPAMISGGSGSLTYVSSVASSIKGVPRRCLYGASKAGLIGLAKGIAADFAGKGIRANCVCPGTVDTPSLRERVRAQPGDYDTVYQDFVRRQPMGRLGRAEEIGALVAYLSSDRGAFINGQAIAIDGGWTI